MYSRQRVVVRFEVAVGARAARVHHALRDALVVEVGDLLADVKVLQQRRSALADGQRVVGVVDAHTLLSRQVSSVPTEPCGLQVALLGILVGGHGLPL